MKSLRLLITANGSLAANAVVLQQQAYSAIAAYTVGAFLPFLPHFSRLRVSLFGFLAKYFHFAIIPPVI